MTSGSAVCPCALRAWIAGTVAVAGVIAVGLLIATDDLLPSLGPRALVLLFGVALALPAYAIVMAVLRRDTRDCSIRFVRDRMRVTAGDDVHEFRLAEIDEMVWRPASEYARVEVASDATRVSLIVGIARQSPGVAAGLPALSGRMKSVLAGAGLVEQPTRRSDIVTLRRADA